MAAVFFNQSSLIYFILAVAGGFLPTIFWLWFWLHEDKKKPEPMRLILKTFIVGGFFIILAFVLEKFIAPSPDIVNQVLSAYNSKTVLWQLALICWPLFAWAIIEELVKYLAAYVAALKNKDFDEPIDAMIYMITAALGFAAVENFLFLLNILGAGDLSLGTFLLTGNLRFLGATLLHTVSSAILGAFLSLAFYRKKIVKILFWVAGFIIAVALHALFNFFIIINESSNIFRVLFCLWLLATLVIFLFEVVKRLAYIRVINKPF